jgi:hypothetical protein
MSLKISGESQAVLLKYGLLGLTVFGVVYYIKLKIESLDLNPFDENGSLSWVPKTISVFDQMQEDIVNRDSYKMPVPTAENPRISGYDKSHDAAMAKAGYDIQKYYVWYPNLLSSVTVNSQMPKGTVQIRWGDGKIYITYYAPKASLSPLSVFY